MSYRIQLRRDTEANWTSANPTLAQGEFGYETDTGKLKLGDGSTAWNSLSYFEGSTDNLGNHEATQILDMNSFAITGLKNPTGAQDAATRDYVLEVGGIDATGYETVSGDYLVTSGDYVVLSGDYVVLSGDYAAGGGGSDNLGDHEATQMLDMNTYKITGLGDPIADQDATTKIWVSTHYTTGEDFLEVSGDYAITSGTIEDYIIVSGDYSITSGTVDSYAAHTASTTAHHDPTGYETISGDFLTHEGSSTSHHDPTGYETVSGDYIVHEASSTSHHDPTGYETISGEWIAASGDLDDYKAVSGDYATTSGTVDDYAAHKVDVNAHIDDVIDITLRDVTGFTGSTYKMYYSTGDGAIEELALGTSGYALCSRGPAQYPTWTAAGGAGGDNLGDHEATQMLDMNTYKITGLGDPAADQDAATKKFTDDHNWLEADITDLDTSGYETVSGDYIITSGTISDYPTLSGDYSASSGDLSDYKVVSGDYATTSGTVDDYATVSGDFSVLSGTVEDYKSLSGDFVSNKTYLELDPTLPANQNITGIKITMNVAAGVAFGNLLTQDSDGAYILAASGFVATMPALTMAAATATSGNSCEMLLYGSARDDGWNWSTPGGTGSLLYVGSGVITQTIPSTAGDQVQVIGWALSADEIMFTADKNYVEVGS